MAGSKGFEELFAARDGVLAAPTNVNDAHPARREWWRVTEPLRRDIRWRRPDLTDIGKAGWLEAIARATYDNSLDLAQEAERITEAICKVQEPLRDQPQIVLYSWNSYFNDRRANLAQVQHVDGLHIEFDDTSPYVHIGTTDEQFNGPFDRLDISDIETALCSADGVAGIDIENMLGNDPLNTDSQLIIGEETINAVLLGLVRHNYTDPEIFERARFLLDQVLTQRFAASLGLQTGVISV